MNRNVPASPRPIASGWLTEHRLPVLLVLGLLALLVPAILLNTSSGPPASAPAPPAATTTPPPDSAPSAGAPPAGEPPGDAPPGAPPHHGDPWADADAAMARMVDARAAWHAPRRVKVDVPVGLGLSIGDTQELRRQIQQNLPGTEEIPTGPFKLGTDVSATLRVDPEQAHVEPDVPIDASTGSAVGLLWTWQLRALQPVDELHVTAHLAMRVPNTEHTLNRDVPLTLAVERTPTYTVHQVFTNWGTWVAIVGAVGAAVRWLWRRLRPGAEAPARPPGASASDAGPGTRGAPR